MRVSFSCFPSRPSPFEEPRAEDLKPGDAFDAAPYAFKDVEADGKAIGLRWAEPRKIRRVIVEFGGEGPFVGEGQTPVLARHLERQARPDPRRDGCGRRGWDRMDDWTNGKWRDADSVLDVERAVWTWTFTPTGAKEFTDLGQPGVGYRKTLKVRSGRR